MIRGNVRSIALLFVVLCILASNSASPLLAARQYPRWTGPSEASPSSPVLIRLFAATFDPLQTQPDLPARLSFTERQASAAGIYIVQFIGPVMPEWKQALLKAGGQLGDYIPDYAFLAHLDPAAKTQAQALPFVRWIGPYQPAYKLAPDVDYVDTRSYHVVLAPWAEAQPTQAALEPLDAGLRSYSQGFSAVLSGEQLDQVARLPDVVWIEPYHMQRLYNDVGGGNIMGGSTAWTSGYTGQGVTVAIADTGLDTGNPSAIHQDFGGRVAHISSWPVVYANYGGGCQITNAGADDGPSDRNSHGTHVAGSVAGSGAASGGQFKGLGYQATLTFQAVEQLTKYTAACGFPNNQAYGLTGIPDDVRDLLDEAYGWGARIHNNSWGGGKPGVYDQVASQFDDFIFTHPDMAVMVSAGNDGTDADSDGYVDEGSIKSPGTAKNVITVGATDNERTTGGYSADTWGKDWPLNYPADPTKSDRISSSREEMAAFSSRGPMSDGRIKPDVVAPGTDIISVRSSQTTRTGWGVYNQYYMYNGGTSMAAPLTSGAATIVRDYYIDHESHADPSAALIKATLINSAVDIAGYGNSSQEAGQPIPNNHEGWGRVNVANATTPGSRQFVDNATGVNTGATETYQYNVSAGKPFKVTLAWSDAPATSSAGAALVNNLNLRVTAPNGAAIYWGNHFSGGWSQTGGSADTINNVENVYIQSPDAGQWMVQVIGVNVPQGPQAFALVVDGNIGSAQPAPTVTSITPNSGSNNGAINVTIVGTNFQITSTIKLTKSGESDIDGVNVNRVSDSQITCNLDLTGAAGGAWNVVVTNPDNKSGILPNGFTVNAVSKFWTGSLSSDWHTAGNWSPAGAPTAADHVVIPNVTRDPAISNGNAAVNNLTLNAGAVLDLTNRKLTVEGMLVNNGTLKQTQLATAGSSTRFLRITDLAGAQAKYYGIDVTFSSAPTATAKPKALLQPEALVASGTGVGTRQMTMTAINDRGVESTERLTNAQALRPEDWNTIITEDFEGTFPGPWYIFDNNGASGGEYYWARPSCRPFAGSYSGWAVGGGANGASLPCGSNYPDNAAAWMVYGPFSLADATAADLSFKLWLDSETDYDKVGRLASINGTDFYGYYTTGNSSGWLDRVLDLAAVPTLGNLMGRTQVWIALVFTSDVSNSYPEGAYVDNIVLRKYTPSACAPIAGLGFTWQPAIPVAGRPVTFTSTSVTGTQPITFTWNLDGNHVSGQSVNYVFTTSGTRTVGLEASNACSQQTAANVITVTSVLAPMVTSITPASGVNTGTVHITNLAGNNFQAGAAVKLTRTGQADISASNVNVAGPTQITCDFDLTQVITGPWNIVVANPGSQSGTLPNGFAVNGVAGVNVTVSVSGNQFCAGRASGVRRCFNITSAGALDATVRFYFTEAERNNQVLSDLLVFHYSGADWIQEAGSYNRGGTGDAQYVEVQNVSIFSLFALRKAGANDSFIYLPVVMRH